MTADEAMRVFEAWQRKLSFDELSVNNQLVLALVLEVRRLRDSARAEAMREFEAWQRKLSFEVQRRRDSARAERLERLKGVNTGVWHERVVELEDTLEGIVTWAQQMGECAGHMIACEDIPRIIAELTEGDGK